ncbi:MAG: hypothetical protein EOM87_00850 [Clostridia bacterium]|nr:hypothetical protein [Clostridia bacterium]
MEFNKIPLTRIAATLAEVMGISPPESSEKRIDALAEYIAKRTLTGKVDRVLVFNPDAIGQWIYEKYIEKFSPIIKYAPHVQPMLSVIPPKTPVCFASIYSGAEPSVHKIDRYTKPVLKIDTMFDALIRAGKKPCIISVANQSMDKIFKERDMAYYSLSYDGEVIEKALELIERDEYDFIAVYNQEYDDCMHRTHPQSKCSLAALDHYAANFERMAKAVMQYWGEHDTLLALITDHGVHREWFGLGQHGKNIPKDMNIAHFYGVIPKNIAK